MLIKSFLDQYNNLIYSISGSFNIEVTKQNISKSGGLNPR